MHSEYSYRNLLAAPAKLNAAWEFIEAGISNESCSTVWFGTCISLHLLGVIVPMATIPNSMRPDRNRTVFDMQKGERARFSMHSFLVDQESNVLYVNQASEINEPDQRASTTVELYLDEEGKFHVDWEGKPYVFGSQQVTEMKGWISLSRRADIKMVPVESVVNWPAP